MLRLAPSILAASALHVAVLAGAGMGLHATSPAGQGAAALHASAGGWQWRLMPAPPARTEEGSSLRAANDATHETAASASVNTAAARAEPGQAAGAGAIPRISEGPSATAASGTDEYLPRTMLTRPPRPQGNVDIPFPPGVPTPGRYKAVLALYIDESGTVRRVKVADEALPAAYEEAARIAFQTASFEPGEVRGAKVKSLIHVEVIFEETARNSVHAAGLLGQGTRLR